MKKKLTILMSLLACFSLASCLATGETTPEQQNNQNGENGNNGSSNEEQGSNNNDNQGENEHSDDLNLDNDGSVDKPYTIDEACAIAETLGADDQTPIKYFIKGYVVSGSVDTSGQSQYGNINFDLSDQGGTKKFKCFQVYYLNAQKFTASDVISAGDIIVMFSSIVNYHGNTPETTNKGTAYVYAHNNKKSSTVPEQGFPKEDPNAQVVTISALKSANSSWKTEGANSAKLYRITGIAQWAVNSNYGNFDITDNTGNIYVHGCTRSKQSLVNDGDNGLIINNDKSFSSIGIKPGDEVTIEGWYAYHAYTKSYGVPQFTGYVTKLVSKGASTITPRNYSATETYSGDYYSSIGDKSGTELLTALHNLMDTTHTTYISYNGLYSGYSAANENTCFYANTSLSNGNREHVWPQSLSGSSSVQLYGENHGGSDFHHVRHANSTNNSKRGNAMFGPVYGSSNGYYTMSYSGGGTNKYTSNVFEPADDIKGDCARIIMYMYMHYNCASNVGNPTGWAERSYYGEMHINWVMGCSTVADSFKLLRLWNALDPVSSVEIARNEQGFKMQGNRNPFIDHPSYADKIWG